MVISPRMAFSQSIGNTLAPRKGRIIKGNETMQINHLISHFDKTYTYGGFSVGLQIFEDEGTSRADIYIIKKGHIFQCNFDYVSSFIGDAYIDLQGGEDGYEELEVIVRESIKDKLTDWLCANGY